MGRKKKAPRPKPVINYPPVPTRKWIPPDKRPKKPRKPAYVKPPGISQKLKISSLKKIWRQFTIIGNTSYIIGHYSQTHKRYIYKTNGFQGACNCAMACTFAYLNKMATWNRFFLDRILDEGDDLYLRSLIKPEASCMIEVPPESIFPSFFLGRQKITLSINEGHKIVDKLPSSTEQKAKDVFKAAVENFFKSYPSGIFCMLNKYLAIWIQDDAYYMFDPTEHDELGGPWLENPGEGYSFLCRCLTLDALIDNIYNNVNARIPHTKFEIVDCTVARIVNINTIPPETFEECMARQQIPPVIIEEINPEEMKPIDVLAERLRAYIEEDKEEVASIKVKIEEISPDVTENLSLSKRPSWLQGSLDKNDVCKFPIPHKARPDKLTFYIEILPEKLYILRGSTCQTDPNFSKYNGRQSMGNAISALIMLRFYKSKVWVPRMVNSILKYGDLLYRDAMISIPRTQSLKLSNFQRKTEYEGRRFAPVIQDYVVVGKLQSPEYDVVDLYPALESFLADHECCVVLGPITLAIWVEDGKFYWFDPNERDKYGKAIPKLTPISGNIVQVENPPGVACIMKFYDLKDLVELYMYNTEKLKRWDPFYISKVTINDYVDIPDPWYNFKGLVPGKWILRGTINQASKRFTPDSRNLQSPATSLITLAFQILTPEKDWEIDTIDEILGLGDQFYKQTVEKLQANNKFVSYLLTISEINDTFEMYGKQANFEIGECVVNGIINTKRDDELMNLRRGLDEFFIDNEFGVVTSHNISVAIWKKEGVYYYFDPHSRDDKGLAISYGTACVLRLIDIEELSLTLEMNLSPGKEDFYNITWVKIKFYEAEGGIVRPPLNYYKKVNDDTAILRSIYSEITTKYDLNCRKQTIPMGVMALAFNKLKPAKDWTKADLDEIMNKGDDLYVQTMNTILKDVVVRKEGEEVVIQQSDATAKSSATTKSAASAGDASAPPEDTEEAPVEQDGIVDTSNVNREFYIGLNKIKVDFEDISEGNINETLKESLKTFFEAEQTDAYFNQEALLESKPLSLVVWRDEKVYYLFDSKPRDKSGFVIGAEDWSEYEAPPPEEEVVVEEKEDEEKIIQVLDDEEGEEEGDAAPAPEVNLDELEGVEMQEGEEQAEEEGAKSVGEIKYPVVHKSSSYWREQEKNGRACTMWFINLDDLIEHIYGNIPPKLAMTETFTFKSVKVTNTAELKDKLKPDDERNDVYAGDWYYFEEIDHGKWIMRGTMNLMNEIFPEDNRGKQMIPASLVALAVVFIYSMLCLNQFSVDTILTYGDKLFTFVKKLRKKQLKDNRDLKLKDDEIDWLVQHETFDIQDIVKRLCIARFFVNIEVEMETLKGDINAQDFEDILDVKRGLETFFQDNLYGILQCKDLTVAIWRGQKTYYMFDGMNRGPSGVVSPSGTACITRYLDLEPMSKVFLANLPKFGRNSFVIHKVTMTKDICPRAREPKMLEESPKKVGVDTGGFHDVLPGKCIVRGNITQLDPKFAKEPNSLCAPIAFIALTMSLIHKPDTWSRPIVDEIIELGAELYDESMHNIGFDFNPWEEKLDVYRVKNDYRIGVLKANCELRNMDQKGIIEAKEAEVLNLRQGIANFFEENTHGIIVTEPLTLAIWEEQEENTGPLIYMFDPNPRGPAGMPLDTGVACVMTFVNATVTANHIIGCILDPVQKLGEFTIVPVEIVVGNARTVRKVKKSTTKSELGVPSRCSKLVADEEKKMLRKIAENEWKRKEAKRLQMIGRNGYYLMQNGASIIRGYRSQNSDHYNENSRGNQDIANCIVSIVMHSLLSIDKWSAKHVDLVLDTGDQLYIDSYIAYGPKDKKLGLANIVRKFFLKNLEIHVTVYKPIVTDLFNAGTVTRILNVYFQQEAFCMLSYTDQWVSIFFKSGCFYLFDPHERDIEGNVCKKDEKGTAVVLKFDNLNDLSLRMVQNLYIEQEEDSLQQFSLYLISVENKG